MMNTADTLFETKLFVLYINETLNSSYMEEVREAMEEYLYVVEEFYFDNKSLMTLQQYETAKRDIGFFIDFLDRTLDIYKERRYQTMH